MVKNLYNKLCRVWVALAYKFEAVLLAESFTFENVQLNASNVINENVLWMGTTIDSNRLETYGLNSNHKDIAQAGT